MWEEEKKEGSEERNYLLRCNNIPDNKFDLKFNWSSNNNNWETNQKKNF